MKITPVHLFLFYLLIVNAAAFFLFGMDKYKASHQKWRIRESSLFLAAALGGSVGALLGMRYFHHKTRKPSFAVGIPLILIAQLFIAALFFIHHFWYT